MKTLITLTSLILSGSSAFAGSGGVAESRCDQIARTQYEDIDESEEVLKPGATLLFDIGFDAGYVEEEDEYYRQCMILSDGRVVLQTSWGYPVTRNVCKTKRISASKIQEIQEMLAVVRTLPLQETAGMCDGPGTYLSLRDGDRMAMWETNNCTSISRGESAEVVRLREKVLKLCKSARHYKERRELEMME